MYTPVLEFNNNVVKDNSRGFFESVHVTSFFECSANKEFNFINFSPVVTGVYACSL